jgi:hypothetical protein
MLDCTGPCSCLLSKMCTANSNFGIFVSMYLWYSRNFIFETLPVWPTCNLSHVLNFKLQIPRAKYLFSISFLGLGRFNSVFEDRNAMGRLMCLNTLVNFLIKGLWYLKSPKHGHP